MAAGWWSLSSSCACGLGQGQEPGAAHCWLLSVASGSQTPVVQDSAKASPDNAADLMITANLLSALTFYLLSRHISSQNIRFTGFSPTVKSNILFLCKMKVFLLTLFAAHCFPSNILWYHVAMISGLPFVKFPGLWMRKLLLSAKWDDKEHLNTQKKMLVHCINVCFPIVDYFFVIAMMYKEHNRINWTRGGSDKNTCLSETALKVIFNLVTFVKDFLKIIFLVSMYYSKIHAFGFRNCQRKWIILPRLLDVVCLTYSVRNKKKSVDAKFNYVKSWKIFTC